MSSKEEIAQRLLDRCARIEESRRKIDEQVNSKIETPVDLASFKEQMQQVRIEMLASQEESRQKQEQYEDHMSDLKAELDALQVQQKLLAAVDKNREEEQIELKRNVAEASAMAEIAQRNVIEAHEENVRLKGLIKAMKDGDADAVARLSIGTPSKRELAESKAKMFFQNLGARFKPSIQNFNNPVIVLEKQSNSQKKDNISSSNNQRDAAPQKITIQKQARHDESSTGSLTDETSSMGAEA